MVFSIKKFSINITWPKHVHSVSLAHLRPWSVLFIFKNYTQSLTGMLRLVYGLLNCFEQSFKYSFISRKEKKQQTNKNRWKSRAREKVPVWEKKQNKRTTLPHQVQLRTKWSQNSLWSEEMYALYGREKYRQSQLLTAAPALQTRLWHFQLLISLITVQSWPAGAGPCRSSPADLQHWTVCSSFMDYTGTLLVSFLSQKKGFVSMQKNELLKVNPVQRGSSTDLLWTVPSERMFGH